MKIAYIGDFINHGKSLPTAGTSMVILMSMVDTVETIDVYCPVENPRSEAFSIPSKVKVIPSYRYDDPISIIQLLNVKWKSYDAVILNLLPTAFGNSSVSNAIGLSLPLIINLFSRRRVIKVIYHNSSYTNDVKGLGYNSIYDRIREYVLHMVERIIFKRLDTFVLLELYKKRIDYSIKNNRVKYLKIRYLEAITTVYMNNKLDTVNIEKTRKAVPNVLMHGSWGPQKNLEMGLAALRSIHNKGIKFKLLISGGINHHFPGYDLYFQDTIAKYSEIIDQYLGPIPEKSLFSIMLNTDLLILPYNSPGGHSGVLEQSLFFEVPTVAIDFPEYREQIRGFENIKLVKKDDFSKFLEKQLSLPDQKIKIISISSKILEAKHDIMKFLSDVENVIAK